VREVVIEEFLELSGTQLTVLTTDTETSTAVIDRYQREKKGMSGEIKGKYHT